MTFGWEYPPGVSGRERQIAGADWEGTVERACAAPDVEILVPNDDVQMLAEMTLGILTGLVLINEKKTTRTARAIHHLERIGKAYEEGFKAQVGECPFDGEVDAQVYQTSLTWTCPLCGTEHEEEIDDD